MSGFLLPNEIPYCKYDREAHRGWPKKLSRFWVFFSRPTSDVNISKTVYPIYFKIKVQRVPTSHSSYINFQVNWINRFRDIDVGSWPKKTTKNDKKNFDHPLFILFCQKKCQLSPWRIITLPHNDIITQIQTWTLNSQDMM